MDASMEREIKNRLEQVEAEYSVRILFAAESGSRAWGLESPDSDYDVRFVYVRPLREYLRVDEPRDVIEWQLDAVYDINGWDFRKALMHLGKSNPVVFEWLNSPLVYREAPEWAGVRDAAQGVFSERAGVRHYYGLAKNTFLTHLTGDRVSYKKYFYALRPLLAARYIESRHEAPPMRFQELMNQVLPEDLREAVTALLEVKRQTLEGDLLPRIPAISDFIEAEIRAQQEILGRLPDSRNRDIAALNRIFQEIVLA